jgi:RimJ/RimL family protein N-acetyltransferase
MLPLTSGALTLRPVTSTDLDALLLIRNDPAVIGSTALGTPMAVDRMRHQVNRWVEQWESRNVGSWLISNNGEGAGYVALDPIGEGYPGVDPNDLEIGVVIRSEMWGQSIARDCGGLVVNDCFTRGGLDRQYATVDLDNTRSMSLLASTPGVRLLDESGGERLYELTPPSTRPPEGAADASRTVPQAQRRPGGRRR